MTERPPTEERTDVADAIRWLSGGLDEVLRAIALVDAAAERGDPDALERKALFEAVGCRRQQSWERAFDYLAQAAERGSQSAKDQLRILARVDDEARDWEAIRSGISIEKLLVPPDKQVLSEAPRLRVMRGFASAGECAWLVQQARERLRPASAITESGAQTLRPGRTNRAIEYQLADMDVVVELVRARISFATRLPLPIFETSQVLHYAPGQEFRTHHDYLDPDNPAHAEHLQGGQRIATFLIYLNDDFEGGETSFPHLGINFRGKTGEALVFGNLAPDRMPDPRTQHAGRPPTRGVKWLFSQWIRNRYAA